jgi:hypothetical protein
MTSGITVSSSAQGNYPPIVQSNQAYHSTSKKVAIVAGIILGGAVVAGALGLAGVAGFDIIPLAGLSAMTVVGGLGSMLCSVKAYWASRIKEDLSFKEYVEKKCPGYTFEQAQNLADFGQEIISKINHASNTVNFYKKCSKSVPALADNGITAPQLIVNGAKLKKEDILLLKQAFLVPVSWHFIRCAFETGQGFEKGMIKFEDSDNKIVKFFKSAMYKRSSSHFKKDRENSLGCDFPKGLPSIFKHVHMGALKVKSDKTFSFIKLEEYGCSTEKVGEMLAHGGYWVLSNIGRLMGEYDGPNERKEKQIPGPIKKAFKAFCKTVQAKPDIKPMTIASMVAWAKTQDPKAFNKFIKVLDRHFPELTSEYHAYRTGNEAIICK